MSEENKIRDAADAIKGIVEAVPVYQDVVQPAAREVGAALQTVAKTLHILLAPVSGLVWGYDKIRDFVGEKVAQKLSGVPAEELRSPEPHVAGPALEALRYTGYQESLRDMYANLLATSIDTKTAQHAHPAFVEIIRQMSPDEALIVRALASRGAVPTIDIRAEKKASNVGHWRLRHFSLLPYEAQCASPNLGSNYLVNLARLGVIEIRERYRLQADDGTNLYSPLLDFPDVRLLKEQLDASTDQKPSIAYGAVMFTQLGDQFCSACVSDDTHIRQND